MPFTTTLAGSLEATVDWTFATNDIDVYLTQGSCDADTIGNAQCPILAFSESTTAKPEKIRVASAAAGTYILFVANVGPGDETISLQVVLTPTATGATPLSASSRTPEGLSFRPKFRPRGSVELR